MFVDEAKIRYCFNSLLVQLEASLLPLILGLSEFQFLTGTIRSLTAERHKTTKHSFNSLLVQLEDSVARLMPTFAAVSIPYWYN